MLKINNHMKLQLEKFGQTLLSRELGLEKSRVNLD